MVAWLDLVLGDWADRFIALISQRTIERTTSWKGLSLDPFEARSYLSEKQDQTLMRAKNYTLVTRRNAVKGQFG